MRRECGLHLMVRCKLEGVMSERHPTLFLPSLLSAPLRTAQDSAFIRPLPSLRDICKVNITLRLLFRDTGHHSVHEEPLRSCPSASSTSDLELVAVSDVSSSFCAYTSKPAQSDVCDTEMLTASGRSWYGCPWLCSDVSGGAPAASTCILRAASFKFECSLAVSPRPTRMMMSVNVIPCKVRSPRYRTACIGSATILTIIGCRASRQTYCAFEPETYVASREMSAAE